MSGRPRGSVGCGRDLLGLAGDDDHVCALLREAPGHREAQADAAGDAEGHLFVEPVRHRGHRVGGVGAAPLDGRAEAVRLAERVAVVVGHSRRKVDLSTVPRPGPKAPPPTPTSTLQPTPNHYL